MMKKRILASSMASVMALSSISVVAFADEKNYGAAVTKAELQEYVDSKASFIEGDLLNYGTVQAEKFQAAVDHAKMVLADSKAVGTDYAAAYQMCEAVREKLEIYTADQLKDKIKEYKAIYDTNNILNEDLQDNIYTTDTFADFQNAYDDAERYVDSEDSRLITDAYMTLVDEKKGLVELDDVTKSDFRKVLQQYEQLAYKFKNYETWRRGALTVAPETYNVNKTGKIKNAVVTFGELQNIVHGSSDAILWYWDKTTKKAVSTETDDIATATVGNWICGADDKEGGLTITTTLEAAINTQYDTFDNIKTATRTTDTDIVAAYNAAVDAVAVFNGWKADSYVSGSQGSCNTLLKKYHNQLLSTYSATTDVQNVIDALAGLGTAVTATLDTTKDKLTADKEFAFIQVKATGYMFGTDKVYNTVDEATTAIGGLTAEEQKTVRVQKVSKGTDILQYIAFNSADIDAGDTALVDAFADFEAYEDEMAVAAATRWNNKAGYTSGALWDIMSEKDANDVVIGLADGKTMPVVKGSNAEWTLLWRQLAYALEDKFPEEAAPTTYTLAKLKALIDEAYDYAEKTGDSTVFAVVHQPMVDARNVAIEFYTAAKATTGYKVEDTVLGTTLETEYKALEATVKAVKNWYKDFPNSYEEIRTLIGQTALDIDDGKIKSDAVAKALAQCAYDLSVLEASENELIGDANDAFDGERIFQGLNRLKVGNDSKNGKPNDFEKDLKKSYDALKDAIKNAGSGEATVAGDVNGDGKVTKADVKDLLMAIATNKTDSKFDVDGNGKVAKADVKAVLMKIAMQ